MTDLEIGKLYRVKCGILSVARGTPGASIEICELYRGDIVVYLGIWAELHKFLYRDEFVFCWPQTEDQEDQEDQEERWEKVVPV